jgi:hypothetical protein
VGFEVHEQVLYSLNNVTRADGPVKIGRQNGIHVTPTVLFDGLKEDSVSSSWGQEEWNKFLTAKLDQ